MDSVYFEFEEDSIFVTIYIEGSTLHINYTGSGTLDYRYADYGILELLGEYSEYYGLSRDNISDFAIGIGLGIDDYSDFEGRVNEILDNQYPYSISRIDSATPAQPQQPAAETIASPTNDKLEVNGNAADPTVYKIGDSNYFKIRDVAALLNGTEKQFAVGYDGSKNAVTATTGQGYDKQSGDLAGAATGGSQTADPSNDAIYVNGEKITAEVYKINGSNYFKLRDLGKALNFYVGWSADRGMYIETNKAYSE
ncbi:MAG: hypothetical protein HFF51_08815 [Lawsonibacter sp.]|nr:hypothetical protein [Lawsonibacter sp.]